MDPLALDAHGVGKPSLQHPVGTADATVVEFVVLHACLIALEVAAPLEGRQRRAGRHDAGPVLHKQSDAWPSDAGSSDVILPLPRRVPHVEGSVRVGLRVAGHPLKSNFIQHLHRDTTFIVDLRLRQHLPRLLRERRSDGCEDCPHVRRSAAASQQQVRLVEDHHLCGVDATQSLAASHLVFAGARLQALSGGTGRQNQDVWHPLWPATASVVD
mmetsp:Transcript_9243/g.16813  ORF Transcript_9243/g.16813 Transcript_9243/m.16813 type:complete len:214 (-) Transcript_9243:1067-1708(-)